MAYIYRAGYTYRLTCSLSFWILYNFTVWNLNDLEKVTYNKSWTSNFDRDFSHVMSRPFVSQEERHLTCFRLACPVNLQFVHRLHADVHLNTLEMNFADKNWTKCLQTLDTVTKKLLLTTRRLFNSTLKVVIWVLRTAFPSSMHYVFWFGLLKIKTYKTWYMVICCSGISNIERLKRRSKNVPQFDLINILWT